MSFGIFGTTVQVTIRMHDKTCKRGRFTHRTCLHGWGDPAKRLVTLPART